MAEQFSELKLLLRQSLPKHGILIDVGACVGSFSQPFAKKGWTVFAFEPEEENYKKLCHNLAKFKKSLCINKAVSNTESKAVPFFKSTKYFGIHSLKPFHETHQKSKKIETVRLDKELKRRKIKKVTVLKVDVEGADFLVLKGFDFKNLRPEIVMCEFMDERTTKFFNYNHHDIVKYISKFGYKTYVSEWAPIESYAEEGKAVSHKFLRCVPYPLDHQPAWGNLIFIKPERVKDFQKTLNRYYTYLKIKPLINLLSNLPYKFKQLLLDQ